MTSVQVKGEGGLPLLQAFEAMGGPAAYLGVAVPKFPNLFLLMGPGTGLGHNSIIAMIECHWIGDTRLSLG
jgi:cation diffusion facilitator CzcD-associated flavoprotein CzcO